MLDRVLFSQFEAPMTSRIFTLQYKPDSYLFVSRVQNQIKGHLEVRQPWPASSEAGESELKILADSSLPVPQARLPAPPRPQDESPSEWASKGKLLPEPVCTSSTATAWLSV